MKPVQLKVIIGVTAFSILLGGGAVRTSVITGVGAESSPYADFPQEKREMMERIDRQTMEARKKIAGREVELKREEELRKKEEDKKASLKEEKPIKTEILEFVDDPMRNKVIFFTNGWITPTGDTAVSVSGGALVEDTEQGVVLVRHFNEKRFMTGSKIIKTPEKLGAVTIKQYEGMTLTLVAEDGTELQFDVSAEKFE
ncbi:hypothetical protein [Paenibacillus macerans]|uniref:hypothetical protein n=1 Tax=Paenibacillus macerans TaxID=44252 RepID=UPI0020422253|nr:hypothetical protein [Paenibacillus macerans]MCM3702608.1 hypothetical protein [Paenibacillus macerans]